MSVNSKDLKPGDVMCIGGQIGEFVKLFGKKKQVCYRPFGGESTRLCTPSAPQSPELYAHVRVERGKRWIQVTQ